MLRWVYTFDAVKRFHTLSHASQMRIKAFCGVSVYTFHAGISASSRARKRSSAQDATKFNGAELFIRIAAPLAFFDLLVAVYTSGLELRKK